MARFPGVGEIRVDARGRTQVFFELNYDDASGTYTIPVKKGTFVHEVATVVQTACDGTPTLKVGDGDDDDGFLVSTDIAPATAATVTTPAIKASTAIANPYRYGKYYSVEDTIDFIWVKGTSPTAGKIKGYVVMSNVYNDGLTA